METNNASVKTRTASEEEPTTQPLGRYERWSEAGDLRSVSTIVLPIRSTRSGRTPIALGDVSDRRRLERDLHDAVQNELVTLIVKLAVAQEDPDTSVALARTLAELEALAQTTLDSVRNIARGIYPPQLADFGVREALRAQAARVAISVSLQGTAPRSTEQAEEAVYFSCSEAIQNAAKHAGYAARVTLRLDHDDETLRVSIADDGRGFDPARTAEGAGLQNIRNRIEGLGGSFGVASRPGLGAALTISLPWPPAADGR